MDILAQNISTGEIKRLPPKVFAAVKNKWREISEPESTGDSGSVVTHGLIHSTGEPIPPAVVTTINSQDPDAGTISLQATSSPVVTVTEESAAASKESLQSEYESLSGQKPDGRWSEKKLAQKIEELKESK